MTYAEKYAKLKAEHRCTKCGKLLPEGWKRVQCEPCRASRREYERLYTRKVIHSKPPAPRPKPRLSISQVIALAAERHVSYGEMVLILEKEG